LIKLEGGSGSIVPDQHGGSAFKISNADGFMIIFTASTDFINNRELNWKGDDPHEKNGKVLADAAKKSYKALLEAHLSDYKKLFNRVALNLGSNPEANNMSTAERVLKYKKTKDPELEALLFQYGRYLMIASSRTGGLPANLQGLWNNSNTPL
jgi:alpha-L-fucosidase 2